MKLTNELIVPASLDEVWAVLLDVERVAPCLPGASIEAGDGDEYSGTMKVKLGPITSSFQGHDQDRGGRRGRPPRGDERQGARQPRPGHRHRHDHLDDGAGRGRRHAGHVETDLRVTGPAAPFGRGVMQDVSAKLMGQFADCLAAEIGRSAQSAGAAATGAGARPSARRRRRAAKESRWRARCLPMSRSRHRPRRGCAGPPEGELATSTGPPPASRSSFPTGATTKRSTSVRSGARRWFAGWLPWPPRPRSCS